MCFNLIFLLNAAVISNEFSLVRTIVASEEDAFNLYNDYAFRLGFSACKDKQMFKEGSSMKHLKQFNCCKQEKKYDKGKGESSYAEVDILTDCKATIEFHLNDEGGWTFSRYNVSHNHRLCVANQMHFMRSQRGVTKDNTGYLQELKDSGVMWNDLQEHKISFRK
ncbi:hypothetical protein M9H77_35749 [Catharanthus roseus]|uniref:Uncharacterized protein n=1 Tax=Catharanthus roseus TaxID=4058 RepID=A0ACB9ZPW4_CATRO|nr:hypothetical protein M9H77_35749 [Catharanthus roseus]